MHDPRVKCSITGERALLYSKAYVLIGTLVGLIAHIHISGPWTPSQGTQSALNGYGFGHWKRVSGEKKYETCSARSPIFPSPWSAKTQAVCAREEAEVALTTSTLIPRLTGEHEIPEKRELVDDPDRHLQT